MNTGLDRRLYAYREDRAASFLRGKINVDHYVVGEVMQIAVGIAPLHRSPAATAPLDSQLVHGDPITVYERRDDGWLWVQSERDGYVGYIPASSATDAVRKTTHRIIVNRTFVYSETSIKKKVVQTLPLAAEVTVDEIAGDFSRIAENQWIWSTHLRDKVSVAGDFVAIAEMMLGSPYLWGGNTPDGTDCSGLVQTALRLANIPAPRDSDMQEAGLGELVAPLHPLHDLKRGDFIFWKGHVGIMLDAAILLHANGHHMLVVREPLQDAMTRIEGKGGGAVTAVRRLNF